MTRDLALWLAVGGLALLCLALLVTTVGARRASARESRRASHDLTELRARLDDLERSRPSTSSRVPPVEFVITGLGSEPADEAATAPIDGAVFADTVLRETVVLAASFAHGLRRGLAPATRNRIRFEMKQEVRRARKQRRADLRAAQRDLHARQRATLAEEAS